MALNLHIPPCIRSPAEPRHPPPVDQPLRIQIEGPLSSINKLLPGVEWQLEGVFRPSLQTAGPELARVVFRTVYGHDIRPEIDGDMVVRDEYLGWVQEDPRPWTIDYYGVTFDHLVPAGERDPEVLQVNIIEMEEDEGAYAKEHLPFTVDPAEYSGRKTCTSTGKTVRRVSPRDEPDATRRHYEATSRTGDDAQQATYTRATAVKVAYM
ncbi:arginine deiminase type-3 [Fusarium subglutinans]|uniref:Arginine deiminase type-3 n=1 Tax=Gibberella subglutinans TaxID=42677 RepID=A0A8H5Q0H9_GIBSU|nr:arginine deiminase type-3 [Fusarium subglutinans]KAF5606324.1 arginine deiminase type-3 [Fusarium subglutinans]